MRCEEKRRKFHEAVLNSLYPSPPPPPPQSQGENPVNNTIGDVGLINPGPDDYLSGSTSNIDNGEVPEKLTRAQRKRLRKKKLKEDARRRRNIIGPLLPTTSEGSGGSEIDSPGVRKNATEECPGKLTGCSNQKKLKHRRIAKTLAREQLKLSSSSVNEKKNCRLAPPYEKNTGILGSLHWRYC